MKADFDTWESITQYWSDNDITPPTRVVVCAACKAHDVTFVGARHWDHLMSAQADIIGWDDRRTAEQGFVDQFGLFLTREEAREVALASGQMMRNPNPEEILFSEDLY